MLEGWKTLDTQNKFLVTNPLEDREAETWSTINQATRWLHSWGQNRPLIGLSDQKKKKMKWSFNTLSIFKH
jgi:hypothetical protein